MSLKMRKALIALSERKPERRMRPAEQPMTVCKQRVVEVPKDSGRIIRYCAKWDCAAPISMQLFVRVA
jgi:hypothetical protein